jgi:hypothetical protein
VIGYNGNPARKVPAQAVQGVKQFINAVPKYTSHNNFMKNPHKKYFDHDMTVTSMYKQQYLNYCAEHWLQSVTL